MTKDEALKMAIISFEAIMKAGLEDTQAEILQCKKALEQPTSLGDFDAMSKAECVDYIEYLRKEIDLLRFKEWKGLTNDMVRAIGEKCEEKNRGILNWIDFYNGIENMLKDKNYE